MAKNEDPMKVTDMDRAYGVKNTLSGYSGPSTARQQQDMINKYGAAPEGKELYTIKDGKAIYKTPEEIAALDKNIPDYSTPEGRAEINYRQKEITRQEITPQQQAQADARFLQTLKNINARPDQTSVFNGVDYAPATTAARAERPTGTQSFATQPAAKSKAQQSTINTNIQPTVASSVSDSTPTPKSDNPLLNILNPSGDVGDGDMGFEGTSAFDSSTYLKDLVRKQKSRGATPFGSAPNTQFGGPFGGTPPTAMA